MEGKKLCDVLDLKITRVGDPEPVPEPKVKDEGILVAITPPEGLVDLIMSLELPPGKKFTVNVAEHKGQSVAVCSEIGLIRPADGLPDELSFGCWDSVSGFWDNNKLNPPDMTRNDKFGIIGIDPGCLGMISLTYPHGEGFKTELVDLSLGKRKEEAVIDLAQVIIDLDPGQLCMVEEASFLCLNQMIILDHLRTIKRRNRNKSMPHKLIRHQLRQFNKAQ